MQTELVEEARRQVEICNACRYCEGYCSVFPAITRERAFSLGDITQLANLCHNCRGCYYACQYTEPHEFELNLPKILAEVRRESWEEFSYPQSVAKAFQRNGVAIALATMLGFALLFGAIKWLGEQTSGDGFYAVLSHNAMVAIFAPAFLLPLLFVGFGLKAYWRSVGGARIGVSHITEAFISASQMRNLSGGHGDGCNFEDEDRFTQSRRYWHQAVMYGFLLCFAATCTGTILHYAFNIPAPYGLFSLPKLFGITGGILLSVGTFMIARLKLQADRNLSDNYAWGGEMAFIALLHLVSTTGLLLYILGNTVAMPAMLALHLGAVLAFFLLLPFTKMVHGFFRLAALMRDAQLKNERS